MILYRMEYENGRILTLGSQQKINKYDLIELTESYITLLEIKDDQYKNTPVTTIIISYKIIPKDKLIMKTSKIYKPKRKKWFFYTFFGYSLPTTTDINQWGEIITSSDKVTRIKKPNSKLIYFINIKKYVILSKLDRVSMDRIVDIGSLVVVVV